MQPLPECFDIEDGLEKLNTTARKIGNTVRCIVKFLLAVLVYLVLNVCVVLLFDNVKPVSMEFVRLLESGLRSFMTQNVAVILSLFAQYKFVAFSIAVVATAVGCILKFTAASVAMRFFRTSQRNGKLFSQKSVSRVCVFSYKQHVAFLA
ncbi:MAG: hypothetical protein NC132_04475 [Corallococcus sp.]|nr:hypothetical protein [Corallococcus sp.]MCM1359917.1 hypothetical protein [Corallococcus sp.]MCM1395350.1 hypothetical protein [Corallococcus sp.]